MAYVDERTSVSPEKEIGYAAANEAEPQPRELAKHALAPETGTVIECDNAGEQPAGDTVTEDVENTPSPGTVVAAAEDDDPVNELPDNVDLSKENDLALWITAIADISRNGRGHEERGHRAAHVSLAAAIVAHGGKGETAPTYFAEQMKKRGYEVIKSKRDLPNTIAVCCDINTSSSRGRKEVDRNAVIGDHLLPEAIRLLKSGLAPRDIVNHLADTIKEYGGLAAWSTELRKLSPATTNANKKSDPKPIELDEARATEMIGEQNETVLDGLCATNPEDTGLGWIQRINGGWQVVEKLQLSNKQRLAALAPVIFIPDPKVDLLGEIFQVSHLLTEYDVEIPNTDPDAPLRTLRNPLIFLR